MSDENPGHIALRLNSQEQTAGSTPRESLWTGITVPIEDPLEPSGLELLDILKREVEAAKDECIKKRWKYSRRSGEIIVFRDIFEKMIKWVDTFKQIGDIAVQYDPVHAALPWAGVRFLLQIVCGDISTFAFLLEDVEMIAGLIARCTVLERIYLQRDSSVTKHLKNALLKLYQAIASYFTDAKLYFEQSSLKRIMKSATIGTETFSQNGKAIRNEEHYVQLYTSLADAEYSASNQSELKSILDLIQQPIKRIDVTLATIGDSLKRSERIAIQNWLSVQPYKHHHTEIKKKIVPGTGGWLLDDSIFKEWIYDSVSSLVWLHGIPGCGKTMLAAIIIEKLLEGSRQGINPLPAYFYCSRNPAEPGRSKSEAILASIARQLSNLGSGQPILPPALKLYQEREDDGFAAGPLTIDESMGLIIELSELYPQITIVIDALDECQDDTRSQLLDALEQILSKSFGMIKIFISSRNDQDIVYRLDGYPDLCISAERNKYDIASFVELQTDTLISKGKLLRDSSARANLGILIKDKLRTGSAGMFQWANLQLEYLCTLKTDEALIERLGRPTPKLQELYDDLYDRIDTLQSIDRLAAVNTFKWLLCATKTLKTSEFLQAISANTSGTFSGLKKESVLDLCKNLVVLDTEEDVFRFAHLSVREYLETRSDLSSSSCHALIAENCLFSMISRYGGSSSSSSSPTTIISTYTIDFTPFLSFALYEYASLNWITHCRNAEELRNTAPLHNLLLQFCFGVPVNKDLDTESFFSRSFSTAYDYVEKGKYDEDLDFWEAFQSRPSPLFICCAYGFSNVIPTAIQVEPSNFRNDLGRSRLEIALSANHLDIVELLLEHHDPVTEDDLLIASDLSSVEPLALLLKYSNISVITDAVIETAIANKTIALEAISILKNVRGNIDVTLSTLWIASQNPGPGYLALKLLMCQEHIVSIPSELLKAVVSNQQAGPAMTRLLMLCPGKIQLTTQVLLAAAQNSSSGAEILIQLSSEFGSDCLLEMVRADSTPSEDVQALCRLLSAHKRSLEDHHDKLGRKYEAMPSVEHASLLAVTSIAGSTDFLGRQSTRLSAKRVGAARPLSNYLTWLESWRLEQLKEISNSTWTISRRHEDYLKSFVQCKRIDTQGIEWPVNSMTRSYARECRKIYLGSTDTGTGIHSKTFFEHKHTMPPRDVTIGRGYLSCNNIAYTAKGLLYYGSDSKVLCTMPGQRDLTSKVFSGLGDITGLAVDQNVIAVGDMSGSCKIRSLEMMTTGGYAINIHRDFQAEIFHLALHGGNRVRIFGRKRFDPLIHVLDYRTDTLLKTMKSAWPIYCAAFSPQEKALVCVGYSNEILIQDMNTDNIIHQFEGHIVYSAACAWSDNGWLVATAGVSDTVKIWDPRMWTKRIDGSSVANPLHTISSETGKVNSLKFSPVGSGKNVLVAAEDSDYVSIIDADTFQSRQVVDFFGATAGTAFSSDGKDLYIGIQDYAHGCVMKYSRV